MRKGVECSFSRPITCLLQKLQCWVAAGWLAMSFRARTLGAVMIYSNWSSWHRNLKFLQKISFPQHKEKSYHQARHDCRCAVWRKVDFFHRTSLFFGVHSDSVASEANVGRVPVDGETGGSYLSKPQVCWRWNCCKNPDRHVVTLKKDSWTREFCVLNMRQV